MRGKAGSPAFDSREVFAGLRLEAEPLVWAVFRGKGRFLRGVCGRFRSSAGLLDSIYLAWLKLTGSLAACGEIGNCEAVNSSSYAEVAGVPVALLGALGYVAILALLLLEVRIEAGRGVLHLAQFGFTLAGTMYSAYLTYVEIAILRAICPYCVVSAVIMTALWIISSVRLWRLA